MIWICDVECYLPMQQMLEQQSGYVELQEQVLKKLECEAGELDEEIRRVRASLRQTEARVAEIQACKRGEPNVFKTSDQTFPQMSLGERRFRILQTYFPQSMFTFECPSLVKRLFDA